MNCSKMFNRLLIGPWTTLSVPGWSNHTASRIFSLICSSTVLWLLPLLTDCVIIQLIYIRCPTADIRSIDITSSSFVPTTARAGMSYQRLEPRRQLTSDWSSLKMSTAVLIVLLACVVHVDGYSTGPPVTNNPEICTTMTPGHGYIPQSSTPPYAISVRGQYTPYCYVQGQPVTG